MMRRAMPFLAIGVCLVVALGWYFMWYTPAGDDVASTNTQTQTLDQQSQLLEAQVASLRAVADQAPALEARAAALTANIPAETSLDGFIIEANRIANANGIEWVSITPSTFAGGGPGGTGVIPFSAQVNGTYEQLRTYLEAIMKGDRLVVIDSVSINASSGSDEESQATSALQATFDGRMFTSALPEGYVDPNTPPPSTAPTDASSSSSNTAARTGAS